MSADAEKSLANCKIGVLGKGGAGKSTAVVLLARALVRTGYTVCVVDDRAYIANGYQRRTESSSWD